MKMSKTARYIIYQTQKEAQYAPPPIAKNVEDYIKGKHVTKKLPKLITDINKMKPKLKQPDYITKFTPEMGLSQ